jgi:hypothetical protein
MLRLSIMADHLPTSSLEGPSLNSLSFTKHTQQVMAVIVLPITQLTSKSNMWTYSAVATMMLKK